MDDLISRQAAINTLIRESQADGAYGYLDAKSINDALERMPSAQPTQNIRVNSNNALDTISRQAAISDFEWCKSQAIDKDRWQEAIDRINALPSAQPEIIRCKDCRWYKTNYMWNGTEVKICAKEAYEPIRNADDYCSYGERKDDNE